MNIYRFLLARVHINSLAGGDNLRAIRRALQQLPRELGRTYAEAMERIKSQDRQKARRAGQILSWISYAVRELTVKEIQYALAVEPGDPDLDKEALPDIDLLISTCAGLVTVDRKSNIIRFVHYTFEEYLKQTRIDRFPTAQYDIAMICLTYLSFNAFAGGPCPSDREMEGRLQENPLLDYAAKCWSHHVRGGPEQDPVVRALTLKFLEQESKLSCSIQARHRSKYVFEGYTQHFPKNIPGIQVAASFGLKETVNMLICKGADLMAEDSSGMTALYSAASNGCGEVVELLLEKGADIETKDKGRMTALHWAANNGHDKVVQVLLGRGANIDAKTNSKETALYRAVQSKHATVVQLLLQGGTNPNAKNTEHDQTPLLLAAWEGHGEIAQLLLEYGAEPDSKDILYCQTPLSRAAEGGHDNVVRLLLGKDGVDSDSKDKYGRTPLWYAARRGYESLTLLLLERDDVNPDSEDKWGRTPLYRAVEHSHGAIVRLLTPVTSGHFVNHPDPPLVRAAENGDDVALRLLLGQESVNLNDKSSSGQTPLSSAARKGHETLVRVLLKQEGIDLESKCMLGLTPLAWAASNGHETIVKLLLMEGADPSSTSSNGRTPLSWAAKQGHKLIVKLLLEQDGVDPNTREKEWNATPLIGASENGHTEVVKLLLKKGANIGVRSTHGRTALDEAIYNCHEEIVQLLKSVAQLK
jgi:ankyrin repeat protein